jgi:hypothetical protein
MYILNLLNISLEERGSFLYILLNITHCMRFIIAATSNKKKLDKFLKINKIRKKYVIDVKKIIQEEELEEDDRMYLKIIIFQRIKDSILKDRDIYYIPDFDDKFSIEKLLNLKKLLEKNSFDILLFHNDFKDKPEVIDSLFDNLHKFNSSQILKDY